MEPTNETETFFVLMDKDGLYAKGTRSISRFTSSLLAARKFSGVGPIKCSIFQARRTGYWRGKLAEHEPLAIVRVTGNYTYSVPEIVTGVE